VQAPSPRRQQSEGAIPRESRVARWSGAGHPTPRLDRGSLALAEQRLCLRESGLVAHRREQLARFAQRSLCLALAVRREAAALAEQGVDALGDVPEPAPARGRLGVLLGGRGKLAGRVLRSSLQRLSIRRSESPRGP
jgi:hypothetical protein